MVYLYSFKDISILSILFINDDSNRTSFFISYLFEFQKNSNEGLQKTDVSLIATIYGKTNNQSLGDVF